MNLDEGIPSSQILLHIPIDEYKRVMTNCTLLLSWIYRHRLWKKDNIKYINYENH